MLFDELNFADDQLYNYGTYPVGNQNFGILRQFYYPFISSVLDYINHWETVQDIIPPDKIESISAYSVDNSDQVSLQWLPVFDTNFKSFQVQADFDTNYNNPITFDLDNYQIYNTCEVMSNCLMD